MNITWNSVYICRVNSGCANQATIGSSTSLGISLATTGVKSTTVSGAAQSPGAGDLVMIVFGFTNSAHGSQSFLYDVDQNNDSPFTVAAERYATRRMRVALAPAEHGGIRSARWITFPPPVRERVQSRMIRRTAAPRKREPAESHKWQVLTPPPTVSVFRALIRRVFAERVRAPAPSHVLKQTFPPAVQENVWLRRIRAAFAGRKREPGRGLVLKRTFPGPVQENVWRRRIRAAFAGRKRAPADSLRMYQPPAAETVNYFHRILRRVFAARKREPGRGLLLKQTFPGPIQENVWLRRIRAAFAGRKREPGRGLVLKQTFPGPVQENAWLRRIRAAFAGRKRAATTSRRSAVGAPPPAPGVGGLIRWQMTRAGRRLRNGRETLSRWIGLVPPFPPGPAPLLKRVAGWFRLFMRI